MTRFRNDRYEDRDESRFDRDDRMSYGQRGDRDSRSFDYQGDRQMDQGREYLPRENYGERSDYSRASSDDRQYGAAYRQDQYGQYGRQGQGYRDYGDSGMQGQMGRSSRMGSDSYRDFSRDSGLEERFDRMGRPTGGMGGMTSGLGYGESNYRQSSDMDRSYGRQSADYGYGQGYGMGEQGQGYRQGQLGRDYSRSGDDRDYGYGAGYGDYSRSSYGQQSSFGQDRYGQSYQGGMGQTHFGKGPKGHQRSDERIKEEVSDALQDDHYVDASEVEVRVENGEVTLTGTVTERQQKRHAEDCAERVRGVKDVHNQIRVQQGTGSQMGSGLASNAGTTSTGSSLTGSQTTATQGASSTTDRQ